MVKRLILSFVLLDNGLTNLTKKLFPTRWQLTGQCRRCGLCCQEILLKMTPAQAKSKLFTTLAVKWISWLFDFILLRIDTDNQYLVFTCRHRGADGKCLNYRWRPSICRNYPLVDYFTEPRFLPGCGYQSRLT